MARPIKAGLDYFSMDVHLDSKFQLIEALHGMVGFAVVVKLYQKIYGDAGYYCEWTPEVSILFARACGVEHEKVTAIISDAMRWKLFDESMFDKFNILTSAGIQKRYLEATARRRSVDFNSEYLLLDIQSMPVNAYINGVNVDNNSVNACRSTQSKVKESKVNKSKAADVPLRTVEAYVSGNLQHLSPHNMEELVSFKETMTDDMIIHAVDVACANGVYKWAYVSSILRRYQSNGYKTLDQVLAAESKREQQKQPEEKPMPKIRWSL